MSVQDVVERYLLEAGRRDRSPDHIDARSSLFELGLLDSLGFVQLITFIEREFDVRLDDDDLTRENFETLDAIAALVARRAGRRRKADSDTSTG